MLLSFLCVFLCGCSQSFWKGNESSFDSGLTSQSVVSDVSKNISVDESSQIDESSQFENEIEPILVSNPNPPEEYKEVLETYKKIIDFSRIYDETESMNEESNKLYDAVLKKYESPYVLGEIETMYSVMAHGNTGDRADNFGYVLKDITGDGNPELFWVLFESGTQTTFAVFTSHGGEIKLIGGFWRRYTALITENNTFYTISSGGASYVYWNIYSFDENGLPVHRFEFAIDGYDFENNESIYYETVNGEKVFIDRARFDELNSEYNSGFSESWKKLPVYRVE